MRHGRGSVWPVTFIRVLIVGVALVACGVAYLRGLPATAVAVGQPVRQDDFLYTVARVDKRPAHGAIAYVVTLRVDNQAKRVDYQWSDDKVYVTDAAGRRYRASGAERPPLPAGSSAEYEVTFVLPANAEHPVMRYWTGIMMGDVFDLAAYGRAAIAL